MTGQTQLEITWDGPVNGLESHRISLSAFGEALSCLVAAARRIASNAISNAVEPAESGRLAAAAKNLDIEIAGVIEGSGGFSTLLTFQIPGSSQVEMFNLLAENVGRELVESIKSEAAGTHRNAAVRKYLQALPPALTFQNYNLHENGRSIADVTLGKMNLPALLVDPLPALIEIQGRVTGVGFDPKWEVKVREEGASQVTAAATEKQVNRALDMRSADVSALVVSSADGNKLVVLENESTRVDRPSITGIFDKWDATFRALA
jgi:hypothetical protein